MSEKSEEKTRKISDDDFIYISTRLKSLELKNLNYDRYEKMTEAKNLAEAKAVLTECEYGSGGTDTEKILTEELKKYYELIGRYSPDRNIVDFFLYFNDCHNLKSIIKSEIAGADGEHLFIDSCAVSYESAVNAVRDRDFSAYMQNVARAAPEVIADFAVKGDPMLIDIDIDKAMYADLDLIVGGSMIKTDYLRRYFTRKADITNILTAIRIFRLGYSQPLLLRALVPGGSLETDFFISGFDGGEQGLIESLKTGPYFMLFEFSEGISLPFYKIEKAADEILNSIVSETKFTPYGAETVVAFIIAKEAEVKNARIILSGKAASLDAGIIRERLRSVNIYG